jgi:hypothetical protein
MMYQDLFYEASYCHPTSSSPVTVLTESMLWLSVLGASILAALMLILVAGAGEQFC